MRNEKGFTLVEIMVSVFILMLIMTASFQFFESYQGNSSQIGEYDTARLLAVNGIEEERLKLKNGKGDIGAGGIVTDTTVSVNTELFQTIVTKENVTQEFKFINDEVNLYRLVSTVSWRDNELEVMTYVSEEW